MPIAWTVLALLMQILPHSSLTELSLNVFIWFSTVISTPFLQLSDLFIWFKNCNLGVLAMIEIANALTNNTCLQKLLLRVRTSRSLDFLRVDYFLKRKITLMMKEWSLLANCWSTTPSYWPFIYRYFSSISCFTCSNQTTNALHRFLILLHSGNRNLLSVSLKITL